MVFFFDFFVSLFFFVPKLRSIFRFFRFKVSPLPGFSVSEALYAATLNVYSALHFRKGERIAQILFQIIPSCQLIEVEELETLEGYGVRLRFTIAGVSLDRWQNKKERLGRFFAKGLQAELFSPSQNELDLMIIPNKNKKEPIKKDEIS